jgi:hypothetical protein
MDEWKEVRKGTGRDVDLTRKDECLVVHGKGEVALQCLGRDLVLSGPQTWKLVNFQVPRFTRSQCSVDGQSTGTDWTDRVDGCQEQSTKSGQPRTLSKKVQRRDKRSSHDTCKVHGQHRDSSILLGHSTRHRAREGCYLEFFGPSRSCWNVAFCLQDATSWKLTRPAQP